MTETQYSGQVVPSRIPVLVVGAGPAGLMTAVELVRRGVPVRIVDKLSEPSPFSKALGVWPRTFELLRRVNPSVCLDVLGQYQEGVRYYGNGQEIVTIPYTDEARATVLPQPQVEQFLITELERLGVSVERGTEMTKMGPMIDGQVDVMLQGPAATESEVVRCQYLIGADGASSVVRQQLGIEFTGDTYPAKFVVADARISSDLDPALTHYFCSAQGILVVSALPNGEYRFFTSADTGIDPDTLDVQALQEIIDSRVFSTRIGLGACSWISAFRVHARQAVRIREKNVFLVGDAAHIHSPAGGQGLNTGIADAHNLAWKIAAVYHGTATERLLATYSLERKPVATEVVRSADRQTKLWLLSNRKQIAIRDAVLKAAVRSPYFSHVYFPRLAGLRNKYPSMRRREVGEGYGVGQLLRDRQVFDVASGKRASLRLSLPDSAYVIIIDGCTQRDGLGEILEAAEKFGVEIRTLLRRENRLEVGPRYTEFRWWGRKGAARIWLVRPDGYIAYYGRSVSREALRELVYAPKPVKGQGGDVMDDADERRTSAARLTPDDRERVRPK